MLDELGNEMERVDTKLDGVMKKIAKLTNLDDGELKKTIDPLNSSKLNVINALETFVE